MNKIKLIIEWLFDEFILPFLPEGKKDEEDGDVGEDS